MGVSYIKVYAGLLKDTLESNTVRGHSWTLYIHSCKMNQIPAVLMVMQIGSCGVVFSDITSHGFKKYCVLNN